LTLLAQLVDVLPDGLTTAVLLAPVAGLVLSLLLGKKAVAEKILACFFLYSLVFIAITSGSGLLGALGWMGFFILSPLVGLLFVILPVRRSTHSESPGPRGFPVIPTPADPPLRSHQEPDIPHQPAPTKSDNRSGNRFCTSD
jgi:hypothetical protein